MGGGGELIRSWTLINSFGHEGGCLFEVHVGAYSRLGAYLNKYGINVERSVSMVISNFALTY